MYEHNIKDFDSSLLQIHKLSSEGVFSLNICCIKYIHTKSPNRVSIDKTDDNEDHIYLFLDDVDGYSEENNGITYLVFASTQKKQKSIKEITKHVGKKLKDKLK